MANDWYPTVEAELIPWHANLDANAQATGTTYSLSAGQKTAIGLDADNVPQVINFKEAVRAYAQAVTEWADLILRGPLGTPFPPIPTAPVPPTFDLASQAAIEPRTRQYAAIIKADPEYTQQVGENYGIVAPAQGAPGTPALTATALTQSQVRLSVAKAGYSLVAIDSRRGGGAWEQIGVAQTSVFIDGRLPLVANTPELREYRCQGMVDNVRTGALSAVTSAVTVP